MNQSILDHCIKSKPSFKLKDCLSHYDNCKLVALADKQHLLLNMGEPIVLEKLNSTRTRASLFTQIYNHFEEDLFYLPPREIEFVSKLMRADFNVEDTIDYEDCAFLHALGYIYLYHYKGRTYPVMPKELRYIYKTIPKDELDHETQLNNRYYSYAIALTQIHGIYTLEHFMDVWNEYNKEQIDFEEAVHYLDMMYDRQNYFSFDYQFVVTHYPSNDDGYKLLEGNRDKTYPIPTKAEIERYSTGTLGKDSPYFERLAKLI